MSQVEQCYWLVAAGGKTPRFICVEEFGLRWTDAEEKALRLYRREDAEAIAELCDDAWQVLARHAPPSAPASEGVERFEPWSLAKASIAADAFVTKHFDWPWDANAQRLYAALVDILTTGGLEREAVLEEAAKAMCEYCARPPIEQQGLEKVDPVPYYRAAGYICNVGSFPGGFVHKTNWVECLPCEASPIRALKGKE